MAEYQFQIAELLINDINIVPCLRVKAEVRIFKVIFISTNLWVRPAVL